MERIGLLSPIEIEIGQQKPTLRSYQTYVEPFLSELRHSPTPMRRRGGGTQRSKRRVGADEEARGHSVRAGQCESARQDPVRKEMFPFTQQDWIDEQQDLIRKPLFEQHRCQRRTAPEDQAWPVHRLDSVNALNDVRSKTLERTPLKTVRPVGRYIFRGRIQTVRERTARGLRPEA